MKYIKVYWHHSSNVRPIVMYSELDAEGWETRKVWLFRIGPAGFASDTESTRSVLLSDQMMPSVEKISAISELEAHEISKDEFEETWANAHKAQSTNSD